MRRISLATGGSLAGGSAIAALRLSASNQPIADGLRALVSSVCAVRPGRFRLTEKREQIRRARANLFSLRAAISSHTCTRS
ncbi:hypothetical protein PHISCL_11243, partial [Aspergillus sclerotialis]